MPDPVYLAVQLLTLLLGLVALWRGRVRLRRRPRSVWWRGYLLAGWLQTLNGLVGLAPVVGLLTIGTSISSQVTLILLTLYVLAVNELLNSRRICGIRVRR